MNLSILILVVAFGLSAYSCPPPFNDFRYLENATLLREAIVQHRSFPQLGLTHGHHGRRWSHADHGLSPMAVWPANDNKLTVIPFCYVNKFAKNKIGGIWLQAWKVWYKKIGNPGAKTGHSLQGFEEVKDAAGATMFCYTDHTRETWNPAVKSTTLVVGIFLDAIHASATAGFTHPDWNPKNGANRMRIGYINSPDYERHVMVDIVTHEMGHVFGLKHEHQRPDRDHYVLFQCKNLQFYDKAIEELKKHPSITIEELCSSLYAVYDDPWRALGFWYPPSFSTEIKWDRWHKDKEGNYDGKKHPYELENSVKYDYDSIMHYPSSSGSGKSTLTIYNAPLVRWVHGGPDYTPPAAVTEENAVLIDDIPHKRGPSDGDFDGVKRLYAWRDGA